MIAIQTNKDVIFNSTRGIIKMEIDLCQNKPNQKIYEMRIIDSISKVLDQEVTTKDEEGNDVKETIQVRKTFDTKPPRFKTMTYKELDALAEILNIDITQGNFRESINELFRRGLLAITQKECIDGISGEVGRGLYFTEAQDWEIVKEEQQA
ncbi:hypothetical protein OF897_19730 [Chryseobacterium formosus]|uniref:Uncharacterized protein n=1 Tax=Chryseobacterium formosus TaxID=1537363 RepID=A0ABT3XWZ7_9FLAO|nr:hypothetical protein [Chryseobacterium formosus]MCX8526149.1 hypothetical protein [Chryseobacterium formosus]